MFPVNLRRISRLLLLPVDHVWTSVNRMITMLYSRPSPMNPDLPHLIRFAPFEVDTRSGELRRQGSRVKLQEQPFQVLLLLLERSGEVVTREELSKRLWPDNTLSTSNAASTKPSTNFATLCAMTPKIRDSLKPCLSTDIASSPPSNARSLRPYPTSGSHRRPSLGG